MTIGTIERETPPPASIPASHAVSCGAVGVAAALGAGVAGFTANETLLKDCGGDEP